MSRLKQTAMPRLLALLLALSLALGMAACSPREAEAPEESSEPEEISEVSEPEEEEEEEEEPYIPEDLPEHLDDIAEWKKVNDDVVAWLRVPGTNLDEYVLVGPDNDYYLRKDVNKRYSPSGVYYADFRCTFDGTAEGLSRNTVLYGHSLDLNDNPDAPYFSQLKRYLDQDFAEENPYIFFSTEEEDLVWEVFAVFYATVALPYNLPNMDNADFSTLLNEVNKRNEYIYPDINVSANDKILTLSTCTYVFTPGVYPNNYRYVVMARLLGEDEPYRERANLEKNPAPKDP